MKIREKPEESDKKAGRARRHENCISDLEEFWK